MKIPFKIVVEHGMASRSYSDSIVVMVQDRDNRGYGEIVIRDYVSGSMGVGDERFLNIQQSTLKLLAPIHNKNLSRIDLQAYLESVECLENELPILCGLETALYDLCCREHELDIYQLLEREPKRNTINYCGILPIVSFKKARELIGLFKELALKSIRVKLGDDTVYNHRILQLCRQQLGLNFPIRIDANCSWTKDTISENLEICHSHSIKIIEQPIRPSGEGGKILPDYHEKYGFLFMADESILTMVNLREISRKENYQMLNLRLSKNGGLNKLLRLADEASDNSIGYQLGCHVGELGVLSAVGRVAASLLPDAIYVDGSYDEYLLSDNITTENFTFGFGGDVSIKRANGFGFEINEKKLNDLSVARSHCQI